MAEEQEAVAEAVVATAQQAQGPSILRRSFASVADFAKKDKGFRPAMIVSGILLGTTALATPLLGSMVGAGLALGVGLALLKSTAGIVVDNAKAIGNKAGISSMALGVGLGVLTSMPELFISTAALAAGDASIAISNITGSNIANTLLILGGTAALRKIESKGVSWKFNAAVGLGATAVLGAQLAMGALNPLFGGLMLASLGFYLWRSYKLSQKDAADEKPPSQQGAEDQQAADAKAKRAAAEAEEEKKKPETKAPIWLNGAVGLAGVAGLIGASAFTVSSAIAFGTLAGISTAVVGVLAVAFGTSLPELMVNLKAAKSGDTDMAVGNILGSNIFNVLGIGGLLALKGTAVPALLNPRETLLGAINTVAFGGSALLASATMQKTKGTITRKTGLLWMGLYAAFTAANLMLGRVPGAEAAAAPPPAPKPL